MVVTKDARFIIWYKIIRFLIRSMNQKNKKPCLFLWCRDSIGSCRGAIIHGSYRGDIWVIWGSYGDHVGL